MARLHGISKQMNAFLDLIAWSEIGSGLLKVSDDGYNILVGSIPERPQFFRSYNDHPREKVFVGRIGVFSTAAGRYQILYRTWTWIKPKIQRRYNDPITFQPEFQDEAAIELIKYRRALPAIEINEIESAIDLCSLEWASFPGGPYGQGNHDMQKLLEKYEELYNAQT